MVLETNLSVMGSLVWTPQNCTRVPSRPGFSQLWSSQWDSACLDPGMCLSPPSCKATALRKWDSMLGKLWGSSAPQNSTFLGIKGLQCSIKTCLEKSISRKLKQEWSWQVGSWDSPLRVCFQMRASYFLEGWPLSANLCISSTKMAAKNTGGFCPSSKEVVASRVLHHSHEPSGKDSLPSWRTVCVWYLQVQAPSGSTSAWSHSHAPLLVAPNQRPSKASKGLAIPAIPGLLRALCWVCANVQWCPLPILLLPLNFAATTPNAPLHSHPRLYPSQHQLPDSPASSGAIINPCAQTDWILKNLGLKRTSGVTFGWPSKQREVQEGKWELGLWIGAWLEGRN